MSSRILPSGFVTLMQAGQVAPVFLVEIDWPGGTVYFWNGYAVLPWNGHSWVGTGWLGSISDIAESPDMTANGVTLTLDGIPASVISEVLRNDSSGRPGRVFFGAISINGFVVDPYLIYDGMIDVPSFADDGVTASVSIQLEKEFIDNRSSSRRLTDQDQKIDHPTDRGLEFVVGLANKTIPWGKDTMPSYSGGGGGGSIDDQQYQLQ